MGMEAKAITRYIRISPRKMRLVLDMIRTKPVHEAHAILLNLNKKAARLAEKTLTSAEANAKVKKMDERRLYVSNARADDGPTMKRMIERARGQANTIMKRMTHLTIGISEHTRPLPELAPEKGGAASKGTKLKKKDKKQKQTAGAAG